jgi:hypothetical protein
MDTESDADQAAFIRLRRAEATWADKAVRYRVLIDGEEFGSLGIGETKTFSVAPGMHKLKLDCGGFTRNLMLAPVGQHRESPEKVLHLDCGNVADFICSPGWSRSKGSRRGGPNHIALEGPTPGSTPGLL